MATKTSPTVGLLQTPLSLLFLLGQFVKCLQFFIELNSKRLYRGSRREKESRSLLFTSSRKREIRHFHVVVVQWRQRNVQKSVMHVQSCCFACLNLLLYCRSRCRRHRRCLSWQQCVLSRMIPEVFGNVNLAQSLCCFISCKYTENREKCDVTKILIQIME